MADSVLMEEILAQLDDKSRVCGDNSRALMAALGVKHDRTGKDGWSIRAFDSAVNALLRDGKVRLSKNIMRERGSSQPRQVLYRPL